MQMNTRTKKAYGCITLGWMNVMMLLARGHHAVEEIHTLPQLPRDVYVHSVHNEPSRMGFLFILESNVPVYGWTSYVEEGCEIPLSPAGKDLQAHIRYNKDYKGKTYVLPEDFQFPEEK